MHVHVVRLYFWLFFIYFLMLLYYFLYTASGIRTRENTEMGQDGKELGKVYTWRKGKTNFDSTLKMYLINKSFAITCVYGMYMCM